MIRSTRGVALLAALLALPGLASAQDLDIVKPRILIIFDTSGSMAWGLDDNDPTGGDGSFDFPTNEVPRIFAAKEALTSVLLSIGEAEASFSLMRYAQNEGPVFNRFPEQYPLPINYEGTCEGGGNLLVPFGDEALPEILSWIDQREDYPENKELRADGGTPLGGSLLAAQRFLRDQVLPGDEFADCRVYAIILLTDGVETCGGNGCESVRGLSRLERIDGGSTEISTFVVGFGPLGGLQQEELDGLAVCADTDQDGQAFRAADQAALQLAFGRIIGLSLPIERCDGRDNDCDGFIDEGVLNSCGECGEDPPELCNAIDDDCDGDVDEGVRNDCGDCGETPPEACNNVDDDCDGEVDEGDACPIDCREWHEETCDNLDNDCDDVIDNDVTRACGPSIGECEPGVQACEGGGWRDECVGQSGPTDEECDGLDNDCDGVVDGHTRPCGGGEGECASGQQICINGDWGDCQGVRDPGEEVCDERDNDCDGQTDEGVANDCGTCGPPPIELCDGLDNDCDERLDDGASCEAGFLCVFGECTKPCFFGECPLGQFCVAEICVGNPCRLLPCAPGTVCNAQTGVCDDPCAEVECSGDEACRMGECVDPTCADLGCEAGEVCRDGTCMAHPCRGLDCADDEYCRDGVCIQSCAGVRCGPSERCVDGRCEQGTCVSAHCPAGQACVRGACAQDPCGGVACPSASECVDGECVDPPCRFVLCPGEQFCAGGRCLVTDGPVVGEGEGEPDVGPSTDAGGDGGEDPDDAGGVGVPSPPGSGEGCACGISPTAAPGSLGSPVLLLLGLALLRRRV